MFFIALGTIAAGFVLVHRARREAQQQQRRDDNDARSDEAADRLLRYLAAIN